MSITWESRVATGLTVRRLRFPFGVTCETTGPVWYAHEGHSWNVRQARKVHVPPLRTIDVGISGNTMVSVRPSPYLVWNVSMRSGQFDGPRKAGTPPASAKALTRALALSVFRYPDVRWTRELFASTVALSNAELSKRLFVEAESFRQIVRTQRLMRVFFDLERIGHVDNEAAKKYGFSHRSQLDIAFREQFDLGLIELQRALCHPSSPRSRALLAFA